MASPICGDCQQAFDKENHHPEDCHDHPQFSFPYDIDTEGDHIKGSAVFSG